MHRLPVLPLHNSVRNGIFLLYLECSFLDDTDWDSWGLLGHLGIGGLIHSRIFEVIWASESDRVAAMWIVTGGRSYRPAALAVLVNELQVLRDIWV